ncbi:Uncharacterized protein AArcCO_1946 [Halalkaliarchaeum sp. AArc-CO]|uniref:selenium cofactor biosynthesis protein YqeC n=1 Tax=unclassified Halalkaliarchaeum TaxID=2678344 RepID=UPI00217DADBC|nr:MULTISPECIES: selenium cofactor biosynthesis protein YqeC [unclassified Halalkaliarchaeum]MDR5671746.1 selenium cofactor biosynthesis protein YqeC [Halalkaliarchaeum sp. AArc-GB]UWG51243.1 Uncharacterized protein AArcCO_1946 [Halalkaliarchaeum sp. AArc-CO]
MTGNEGLVDALAVGEDPTICMVGAGGKKTTMYALSARMERSIVTSTVRIPIFDSHVASVAVTRSPTEVLREADPEDFPLGLVPTQERSDRYLGYGPETVDEIAAEHDGPVLVKADGARTRTFKAPNEREPQLPSAVDVVVPITSVRVVGRPLTDEWVHRPERVAELTGLSVGDRVTPETVATVLASDSGGLKDVPDDASVIPLLTQIDTDDDERAAREIADGIHARTDVLRVAFSRLDVFDVVE